MQAAKTTDLNQQIANQKARTVSALGNQVNKVNFVHFVYFVHMWKSDKFTAYPHETKGPVYFVHFSRKCFASPRTPIAKLRRSAGV